MLLILLVLGSFWGARGGLALASSVLLAPLGADFAWFLLVWGLFFVNLFPKSPLVSAIWGPSPEGGLGPQRGDHTILPGGGPASAPLNHLYNHV